jgi:hypothetical protein
MYRICRPSSVWLRCVIEDLEIRCAGAEVARRARGQRGAGVRPDAFEQCWAVGSPSKSRQRRENVHPNSAASVAIFTRTAPPSREQDSN